jgi:hypothetical protein
MSTQVWSEPVQGRVIVGEPGTTREHRSWFFRNLRGIDRLGVADDSAPGRSEVDWQAVDRAVQEGLARLTVRVAGAIPTLSWKSNSYNARFIALCSYRIFERLDGGDFDPIYAGMTFVLEDGKVRISGDISGEETGHIYFDQGCERLVSGDHQSVLLAAMEVAGLLSDQAQAVIEAVTTR